MSEALKIDIDARSFQGLLKGLIRRTFFGETKYDNEFLKKYEKRFLIIGSSIPLGWGVKKENTYSYLLRNFIIFFY